MCKEMEQKILANEEQMKKLKQANAAYKKAMDQIFDAVSYTHLTLPTIYSV